MSFVYVPPPTPSRRAKELGGQLFQVIDEYRRQDPKTSDRDVDAAFRLARERSGANPMSKLIALILGFLALGLGLAVFYTRSGGELAPAQWIALSGVLLVVLGALVALNLRGAA